MKLLSNKLLPCLLLLSTPMVQSAQQLPEFTAKYSVDSYGISVAEAVYELSYTSTGYRFTQNTRLVGFARFFRDDTVFAESLVDEVNGQLLLKQHHYHQSGKDSKVENFSVSWATTAGKNSKNITGKVTGSSRGKPVNISVNPPVWDALSFQLPLMRQASRDTSEYPYRAILKGELDTYTFNLLSSTDNISFAGEQYASLHLVRKDTKKDRQLHIWLLPELNKIPVIIENYRDGKLHSRMQLESVKFGSSVYTNDDSLESDDDI